MWIFCFLRYESEVAWGNFEGCLYIVGPLEAGGESGHGHMGIFPESGKREQLWRSLGFVESTPSALGAHCLWAVAALGSHLWPVAAEGRGHWGERMGSEASPHTTHSLLPGTEGMWQRPQYWRSRWPTHHPSNFFHGTPPKANVNELVHLVHCKNKWEFKPSERMYIERRCAC